MERRTLLKLSVAALAAAAAPSRSFAQGAKQVRIGFQKYGKLVLLKSRGSLEPKLKALGYSVTWTEFQFGPPLLEAINVGSIDFGNTGETPPVFAQAAGALCGL
jgi:sulfonate transport system substrate-binding protein